MYAGSMTFKSDCLPGDAVESLVSRAFPCRVVTQYSRRWHRLCNPALASTDRKCPANQLESGLRSSMDLHWLKEETLNHKCIYSKRRVIGKKFGS